MPGKEEFWVSYPNVCQYEYVAVILVEEYFCFSPRISFFQAITYKIDRKEFIN